MCKNVFLYEITHRYQKNDYQFFDTLKTKERKIRGNCNVLIKVKLHKLVWSSPLISLKARIVLYTPKRLTNELAENYSLLERDASERTFIYRYLPANRFCAL